MKRILSLLVFLAAVTGAPAQLTKTGTAVEYNDLIIGEQVKIGEKIKTFIGVFTDSKDSAALQLAREAIVSQSLSGIDLVKQLTPYKGDTALKKNALRLFSFYAGIAANEYKQFVQVSFDAGKTNTEKAKEMQEIVNNIAGREKIYDKNFSDAQKAFAAKYNIDLKENEFKINQ